MNLVGSQFITLQFTDFKLFYVAAQWWSKSLVSSISSQRFIRVRVSTTPTGAIFLCQDDSSNREKAERWRRIRHKVRPSEFKNVEDIRDIVVIGLSSSRHQTS